MSIEVRVPEEIKDYKENIIAGLSVRQLICGGIALLCGIPTFLLLKNVNMDIATYATMLVVVPAFCVGFIKKDGYTFENYIKIRMRSYFVKNRRIYETEPDKNLISAELGYYTKDNDHGGEKVVAKEHKSHKKTKEPREYDLVEVTKKAAERKRKAALKSLKAKAGKYRTKKP